MTDWNKFFPKKTIKNQRNKGLQLKTIDKKLWEYQNQNI